MKITKKLYKKLIERRKEIDTFSLCGRDERLSEIGWIQYFLEKRYPELTEEPPSKEDLLKKAEEDYPEGTIIYNFLDLSEYVVKSLKLYYPRDGNFGICGQDEESVVYYNNEWAKIIKKPILKINDTFLYEGDEYWNIDKNTFVLENHKITKGYVSGSNNFEYFLTQKEALDYIMTETKNRFKEGSKYRMLTIKREGIVKSLELNNTYKKIWIWNCNEDHHCNGDVVWRCNAGFIAEPIKEDVPEWVMPIRTCRHKSYIKNTPIQVHKKEKDQYRFDDNKHGIFISRCRPATKAEIEAHKLGFHIGDKLFSKKHKTFNGIAKSFYYKDDLLYVGYEEGLSDRSRGVTKEKPTKLMLGDWPVTIENGLIKCKDGQNLVGFVSTFEWLTWAKVFIPAVKAGSHIGIKLGEYKTHYHVMADCIKIGCIENATLKQIKRITKAVKKFNKK